MKNEHHKLCLYVAGNTHKSERALENLKKYCEEHLKGTYTIEVIDLREHPHFAEGEQIFATPTLIKKLPEPIKVLVGDLSHEHQFLVGLNLVSI